MLFHEYRIESRASNEILFETNASLLLQALNSGRTSPTCQIKLAKRSGQPCLSIETRVREGQREREREPDYWGERKIDRRERGRARRRASDRVSALLRRAGSSCVARVVLRCNEGQVIGDVPFFFFVSHLLFYIVRYSTRPLLYFREGIFAYRTLVWDRDTSCADIGCFARFSLASLVGLRFRPVRCARNISAADYGARCADTTEHPIAARRGRA